MGLIVNQEGLLLLLAEYSQLNEDDRWQFQVLLDEYQLCMLKIMQLKAKGKADTEDVRQLGMIKDENERRMIELLKINDTVV